MATSDFATVTSDDLVTGEGVALDLPAASLGVRMASGLIDVAATLLTMVLLSILLIVAASVAHDEALIGAGVVLTSVLTFLVLPTALETLTRGRSLGKLALGLRTVRDDGGPISFQHALVRALIGFVEIYAFSGAPAFFSIMLSTRGKRLGDYAAGTYVVRERVPLRLPAPPPMPRELASWARRTDLGTLPTGTALAVRQFLGRLPTLDPVSRDRVGRALLADVLPHVAPAPPRGAPPELVLMAVVAERRERDLARLRRDDQLRSRLLAEESRHQG
ncbi:RDD family protein [Nocardioides albidus]|uniref:RDD family protein n=1 Tax=Nocardioides albidus TaxID=1517589 RepID=A0A5C4VX37_9ACTN|nr:RDD family protein [Nocardioides albidus]TNM40438.1 RDD family protein [Nocardioides albidus]